MKRSKLIMMSVFSLALVLSSVPSMAFAKTTDNSAKVQLSTDDKIYQEKIKDPTVQKRMKQAQASKTDYNRFQQIDKEIGYTAFWSSVDMDKLKNYDSLKNKAGIAAATNTEDANFVKSVDEYISKIDKLNKKNGIKTDVIERNAKGEMAIGSLTGSSPNNFSTPINVSAAVIGDVFLGSYPGIHEQGEIEHAGIYDGTITDQCLWSTDGPGQYSGWDRISHWKTYYNEVWDMNIWPTSTSDATAAFNKAQKDSIGKPYDINANLTSSANFYCSKIPWWGYKYTGDGYDLRRPNFLPAVTPTLIYNCVWSEQRNYWSS